MLNFLEELIVGWWNRLQTSRRSRERDSRGGTLLGHRVVEDRVTNQKITISQTRRTMHIGVIGKNAIFCRERRSLFTFYLDELQNLVSQSTDVETTLSEARKFGAGIVGANQYIDQYPPSMRSAIFSIATHAFFQLSSTDAANVAAMLDGGKSLAERLKNLPTRHFVVKSGSEPWRELVVPTVEDAARSYSDLLRRSREAHARPRTEIEKEIAARHTALRTQTQEALHEWN